MSKAIEHGEDLQAWAHGAVAYGLIFLMAAFVPVAALWHGLPLQFSGYTDFVAACAAGLVTVASYCFGNARSAYLAASVLRKQAAKS